MKTDYFTDEFCHSIAIAMIRKLTGLQIEQAMKMRQPFLLVVVADPEASAFRVRPILSGADHPRMVEDNPPGTERELMIIVERDDGSCHNSIWFNWETVIQIWADQGEKPVAVLTQNYDADGRETDRTVFMEGGFMTQKTAEA